MWVEIQTALQEHCWQLLLPAWHDSLDEEHNGRECQGQGAQSKDDAVRASPNQSLAWAQHAQRTACEPCHTKP
jgi:hypothetical protein